MGFYRSEKRGAPFAFTSCLLANPENRTTAKRYTMEMLPKPNDPKVKLRRLEASRVAS
jgi:hypothetical protein